jgi:hypothetical protein
MQIGNVGVFTDETDASIHVLCVALHLWHLP